ncbi:MAG TPA: class I adenylate-forming enzyme family protein [Chthoniobacterales bacterium]|jgi:acyl-CoA synthetase (AMP-forming)/AMP-acid ligase II|nr:class I adenylate-forming enzyme family protein [Chthoniobacterales bacterium]
MKSESSGAQPRDPGDDPLVLAWGKTLARRGDEPAIFGPEGAVQRTFRDIEERARELEAALENEVHPIDIGNDPDWPSHLLAALRRGAVAIPLESTITAQQREAALRICQSAPAAEPRPVLLKLTSGTTAAPRAIRFRSEQLLADCNQICDTMRIRGDDINFAVIPLSHSYGFSNVVTPLLVRGVRVALSRDRMPRAVLDGLAASSATVFPGMPVFYQAFCEMEQAPVLPNLRLCISAGAPLPLEIARRFREKFGHAIHSFYGSSECGGICYDREARLAEPGFVGTAMEGTTIELVDAGADSSRIKIRTAAAGDGYFPEPDEEKLGRGFFSPDDLLMESETGFRIVGRVSDVINVAGKKVNPAEVEAELLRYPGVRAAIVFGRASARRNEEVAACVAAGDTVRESDLLEFCRQRLSGWQVPKRIFFVDDIPVNERGKVNRQELRERFGHA